MNKQDIPYLLQRARTHRLLGRIAKSAEARCVHRRFVQGYQRRLLAIRISRPFSARSVPNPANLGLNAEFSTECAEFDERCLSLTNDVAVMVVEGRSI